MKKICFFVLCFFVSILFINAEEYKLESNKENRATNKSNEASITTTKTSNSRATTKKYKGDVLDEESSFTIKEENNIDNKNINDGIINDGKSAVLIEASTGNIIYEKNAHDRYAPASMTKIMSMILIMEEIENGNLKWNENLTTSEYASSMGGSQIFLQPNEKMSVKDLFKAVSIGSANDATVVFAERISGSEEEFVNKMNKKAKELNLKDTNFKNATGLDVANHYSSAYDMAVMAKELVKHEKIFEFTTIYEDYLRQNTDNKFWLVNTNKVVY